jgi:hypothetical protein
MPWAALFAGVLLISCASGPPRESVLAGTALAGAGLADTALAESAKPDQQRAEETAFRVHREEPRIPLWEEAPRTLAAADVPALTIRLELLDFSAEDPDLGKLLNSALYRGLGVRDYARDLVRVQAIEYREMGAEVLNNPAMMNSATLNWSYEEILETGFASPRLLVLSRDRAFYSGGAHPNYDRAYFVFDREVAMRVRLSDIVREASKPALQRLVNRELRAAKNLGSGDSLKAAHFFVDEAELSENFFFSPEGLGFHWDPYEIAPYAEGYVEVIVPFGEITAFLSPEGQRLVRELRKE